MELHRPVSHLSGFNKLKELKCSLFIFSSKTLFILLIRQSNSFSLGIDISLCFSVPIFFSYLLFQSFLVYVPHWMCLSKIHVKALPFPQCGGFRRQGLWEVLGLDEVIRAEVIGISHKSARCKVRIQEVGSLQAGRGLSPEPNHPGTLISDFLPPELWERNFCFGQSPSLCSAVATGTHYNNLHMVNHFIVHWNNAGSKK